MTIREAFRLIRDFCVLDDNSINNFQYDANDPRIDEDLDILILKTDSENHHIITTEKFHENELLGIIKNNDYSKADNIILGRIIETINRTKDILSYDELRMVLKNDQVDALLQTICKYENGEYVYVLDACSRDILIKHIFQLEEWASQTYENRKISFALGMDLTTDERSDIHISDLYNDAMLKVLSSGKTTIIVCNRAGEVLRYERLWGDSSSRSPLEYSGAYHWSENKIAIILTLLGEILIFYNKRFLYLKRSAHWYPGASSPLSFKMREACGYNPAMKEALLDTCYDVSFKRCGACIGIVDEKCPLIFSVDCYNMASSPRARFFRQILGNKKFQEIDRAIRLELLAIDGATVMDKEGNIQAIGAILKVDSLRRRGRMSGGRSVAAQQLASYGIGIKISEDGSVEAWRRTASGNVEKFIEVM